MAGFLFGGMRESLRFVYGILDHVFGFAGKLLCFAFAFLCETFAFEGRIVRHTAYALFGFADTFVGQTFCFVHFATHNRSPIGWLIVLYQQTVKSKVPPIIRDLNCLEIFCGNNARTPILTH